MFARVNKHFIDMTAAMFLLVLVFAAAKIEAATIHANPSNYKNLIPTLQPGDTLLLAPGTYPRLNLTNLNGASSSWITIQGPVSGPAAVITVDPSNPGCCNLVQLGNNSYLAIRNLRIDSAFVDAIDGVNSASTTHDVLVEDCMFVGQGAHQGTVAINTKAMAWNWVIRGNTIIEAGTGFYLGHSNGDWPFINGLIERNLIVDTIGYNGQIKFQIPYSQPSGLDAGPHKTIIRHNVFIKSKPQSAFPPASVGDPRPNLLVGGFPSSGYGSNDKYEIYGNFFYENKDDESLFQGSGTVSLHDNILVGGTFRAISLVDHDYPIRRGYAYNNTIYGPVTGIVISGSSLQDSFVTGNLVLANQGIVAPAQQGNIVDTQAHAVNYVNSPSLALGMMNFYPKPNTVKGTPIDMTKFTSETEYSLDFNGVSKGTFAFRGAYAGEGSNPGWVLNAEKKPVLSVSDGKRRAQVISH